MQTNNPDSATSRELLEHARARFGLLLGSVYRQWRRQVDQQLKDQDLTDATRMPLLVLLVHDTPMRQKELAQALSLDTSSLVRVLAQLREKGLIDWQCDQHDRRTKCIFLTPAGQHCAQQILQLSLDIEQQILAQVSADELHITRRTLEKIAQSFEPPCPTRSSSPKPQD